MKIILQLLRESVIVQALVTLTLVGTTAYLYATGQAVPESLLSFDGLALGFYLGAKVQQSLGK